MIEYRKMCWKKAGKTVWNFVVLAVVILLSLIFYFLYFYAKQNRFIKSFLIFLYFPFASNYIFCAFVYGRFISFNAPRAIFNRPLADLYCFIAAFIPALIIWIYYKRHYYIKKRELAVSAVVYLLLAYFYIKITLPMMACGLFAFCA